MAVAAHRARLPLYFFHQIPSPPCHQRPRTAQLTATVETAEATSNNANEGSADPKAPLLSAEGGPRGDGGARGGDSWPPSAGTSAAGLHQRDNILSDGGTPAEKAEGLGPGETTGGRGMKRIGDDGGGTGTDNGNVCVWRRCRVKDSAAAEKGRTGDVAVVVEWDDEVGGQVRAEDAWSLFLFFDMCYLSASLTHSESFLRPLMLPL